MSWICAQCDRFFKSRAGLRSHRTARHRHAQPPTLPESTFVFHPDLTATPCDQSGEFLPLGQPPDDDDAGDAGWEPFNDRPSFQFAKFAFKRAELSGGDLDELLEIWAAHNIASGSDAEPPFQNKDDMYATIDSIRHGDAPWEAFSVQYNGPLDGNSPTWKHATYQVFARNTQTVAHNMISSPDFDSKFDYAPFKEYTPSGDRRYSNVMSGKWAFRKANTIAQDAATHGAMLVPILAGADKTTVSVATGQNEFHPLYMSIGNVHNSVRRAHKDAVIPVAFLAIPKACRDEENTAEFRTFRKQAYHASIARIFAPLRAGMTTPEIVRCPDKHYRQAIYELGPFIADYPEQVVLAGIVQGWCPKCLATPEKLEEGVGDPRCREHTEFLTRNFNSETIWTAWGVDALVEPFTTHFPRADIYELLTPDLLHQLIKGTFKDHLVTWVEQYLHQEHGKAGAERIMDDIDRRIASVPSFPGLRRFPEGRNFKQWTGNDSKALMKVYLPAIEGYVPRAMVRCFAAYLDFCYLARRSAHSTETFVQMKDALQRFHDNRDIFRETGVRPDGFSLPRQHALDHYIEGIQLFGSPNGVCSSITESKHIRAVKRPWRRSSKFEPLGQILRTNQRLDKLAAAEADFTARGMLRGSVLGSVQAALDVPQEDLDNEPDHSDAFGDADAVEGPRVIASVELAMTPAYTDVIEHVAQRLRQPSLPALIRHFLYDQLYADDDDSDDDIAVDALPSFHSRVSCFYSAKAVFYAPSELSGLGGMHSEIIRSNPSWRNKYGRWDTVLINLDASKCGFLGMIVGRVKAFLSFAHESIRYPCALVEWFLRQEDHPDPDTGMWIVEPEVENGKRVVGIVHIDSIVRAVHLMPVFRRTSIPREFHFSYALDSFTCFYVNKYADYHSHEILAQ